MTWMTRLLVLTGGGALLCAMAIDSVAVIGRHVGMPLHGSIELVQWAVLIAGVSAVVVATLAGSHATVHLLVDRLSPAGKAATARISALFSALFFVAILAGGLWIAADMWGGNEESELLGLPYRPLRIIANLAVAAVAVLYLRQAFARRPE